MAQGVSAHRLLALAAILWGSSAHAASEAEWAACSGTDRDKAVKACTAIIERKSERTTDWHVAYHNRGVAYILKKDFDLAIKDFNEAIRLDPKVAHAYRQRGVAYSFKKDFDLAIKDLTEAIRLKSDDPQTYQARGFVKVSQGRFDAALKDYQAALEAYGTQAPDHKFYRGRGFAFAGTGDHDKAIADFNKSLELAPDDPAALYRRGLSHLAKGDMARAIADQARANALRPEAGDLTAEREQTSAKDKLEALLSGKQLTFQPMTPPTTPVRRVALVTGNQAYTGSFSPLTTPKADAKAVADALRKAGLAADDVVEAYDLDRKPMIAKLRAFEAKAKTADWSIVFYAGHGIRARSNVDYLIPVDADINQEQDLSDEAVALERVVERISATRRLQLVMFDACRDNALTRKLYERPGKKRSGEASSAPIDAPGLIIAFSAMRGQQAHDGSEHSPFAVALLAALEKPDTPLDVLLQGIREAVHKATDAEQVPEVFGADYGRGMSFGQGTKTAGR